MNFNVPYKKKNFKPFQDRKLRKKSVSMPDLNQSYKPNKPYKKYPKEDRYHYKNYKKGTQTQNFKQKGERRQNHGYTSHKKDRQSVLPSFFKPRELNYGLSKEEMEIHAILDEEDKMIRVPRRKRGSMTSTTNLRKRNIGEIMEDQNPYMQFDDDENDQDYSAEFLEEEEGLASIDKVFGKLKKVKTESKRQENLYEIPLEKEKPKDIPLSTQEAEMKSAPWMSNSTIKIENTLIRFHNEIIDFVDFISSHTENASRKKAFEKLSAVIKSNIPNATVKPFGSYVTNLYLPQSDIDLVVVDPTLGSHSLLNKLAKVLMKHQDYDSVSVIRSAKVPLVKVVEKSTGINFDISFNKLDGVHQVKEIQKALNYYPEMKYLVLVIKCFLKQRDLNETYQGGIGSFLLFCLVLAFLRETSQGFTENNKENEADKVLLSEYVLKFFDFYANFDISRDQILIADGGGIVQKYFRNESFSVLSPQDVTHDIGSAAFRIREVFGIFKNRYNFMINYSFKKGESVLKYLIAGEHV